MAKKVIVLTTGGTIASVKDKKTGLLNSGQMSGEELVKMVELPSGIEVIVESVFQVPSTFMTFSHLVQLKDRIHTAFEDPEVTGIVVTHGTDTMEESSYFLDLTVGDDRPVVVTGSQRGPNAMGTDALVNIRQAILVAADDSAQGMGTVVLFNEKIHPARNVRKLHSYNVDGFGSIGYGYLGFVDSDQVFFYQKPLRREVYQLKRNIPRVDIVKFYLDTDGAFIRAAVEAKAEGIVIEGTGRGQASPNSVDDISAAISQGVKVVLTSTCGEGQVYPGYSLTGSVHDLHSRGVILGKDYSSRKARVKLAVLLAAGVTDLQEKFSY